MQKYSLDALRGGFDTWYRFTHSRLPIQRIRTLQRVFHEVNYFHTFLRYTLSMIFDTVERVQCTTSIIFICMQTHDSFYIHHISIPKSMETVSVLQLRNHILFDLILFFACFIFID